MGEARKITVEIDGDTARTLDLAVVAGKYGSEAEVILEALRLWRGAYQSDEDLTDEEMEQLWAEAETSGQPVEGNFDLADIKLRHAQRLQAMRTAAE